MVGKGAGVGKPTLTFLEREALLSWNDFCRIKLRADEWPVSNSRQTHLILSLENFI